MAKQALDMPEVKDLLGITPALIKFSRQGMWVDYDQEVDVLYISFVKPQRATHSDMLDNGVLINYRGDDIVGVTIFEASTRR